MSSALFIAWHDVRYQLWQGSTLLWLFVLPPVFFYFIGTVTSGFRSGISGDTATPIAVAAETPGFLWEQVDLRLRENDFDPEWVTAIEPDAEGNHPRRTLTLGADLSDKVIAGDEVSASYDTRASALSRDFEAIRIQRSLYTVLADVVVANANGINCFQGVFTLPAYRVADRVCGSCGGECSVVRACGSAVND